MSTYLSAIGDFPALEGLDGFFATTVRQTVLPLVADELHGFFHNICVERRRTGPCPIRQPQARLFYLAASADTASDWPECRPSGGARFRQVFRKYGRAATNLRSRALRSLTDETICMALVIFCVFLTLMIRRFISRGVGISLRPLFLEFFDGCDKRFFVVVADFLFVVDAVRVSRDDCVP